MFKTDVHTCKKWLFFFLNDVEIQKLYLPVGKSIFRFFLFAFSLSPSL